MGETTNLKNVMGLKKIEQGVGSTLLSWLELTKAHYKKEVGMRTTFGQKCPKVPGTGIGQSQDHIRYREVMQYDV